ncbi:MAG: hypothetical protein ABSB70_15165 [Candidatus Velthaea sp.]|jgi:hypothetical protein
MNLRTVLTIAAIVACLRPAAAAVTNLSLQPVDVQTTQTPPQVFVHAGDALRGARPDDDPSLPLFDATGDALYFTLEKWRAANGTLDVVPQNDGGGDQVTLSLRRLIAFGHYSVFLRTDDSDGQHFVPIDGSGITNNFDAHQDGSASVAVSAPQHITSGTWIVTIYHSDDQDHGNFPGDFTRTAHQQLIVKIP